MGLITQAANQLCGDVWVQVCDSNWSASRRWRRTAFVMSGERLLSSQCAFSLLLPLVASRYLWVICSLRAPPPHLSVDTGLSTGPSWLRCMSQVPRRGVKRAAEVNKSRAGRRPVTTRFTNRPVDSITGYAGHMVPLVTVKLIPCESYRQAGKLLGGAREVLANCTHRFGHLNTSLQASGR